MEIGPVMVYPDEQRAKADSSAMLRNDKQMQEGTEIEVPL
jgi:hypothetical protein